MLLLQNNRVGTSGEIIFNYKTNLRCVIRGDPEIRTPNLLSFRLWLRNKDTCLVVLIYLTTNSESEVSHKQNHTIKVALNKLGCNILVTGDINVYDLKTQTPDGAQFAGAHFQLL